jgi:hypothetical protein
MMKKIESVKLPALMWTSQTEKNLQLCLVILSPKEKQVENTL